MKQISMSSLMSKFRWVEFDDASQVLGGKYRRLVNEEADKSNTKTIKSIETLLAKIDAKPKHYELVNDLAIQNNLYPFQLALKNSCDLLAKYFIQHTSLVQDLLQNEQELVALNAKPHGVVLDDLTVNQHLTHASKEIKVLFADKCLSLQASKAAANAQALKNEKALG